MNPAPIGAAAAATAWDSLIRQIRPIAGGHRHNHIGHHRQVGGRDMDVNNPECITLLVVGIGDHETALATVP